ncbi:MAG: hypothetical protein K6F64_04100 [Clostridia bacterium]|nr:hypothetical protein [Clostridia bacterium]
MDTFKLKSIDEFDDLFVNDVRSGTVADSKVNSSSDNTEQKIPVYIGGDSLIPEIQKNEEPENENSESGSISEGIPVSAPLYESESMNDGTVEGSLIPEKTTEIKKSKGALAGKIISIVLLAATVFIFLCGCFVSVFLDNKGSNIGGYTFNTLSKTIERANVSKGSLIISKAYDDVSKYKENDLICCPSSTGEGCDILQLRNVSVYANSAQFVLSDPIDGTVRNLADTDCYGAVHFYIPFIGSLIGFAVKNALLVCVLFVLLAALWCLVLILISKSQSKKAAEANDVEDEQTAVPEEKSKDDPEITE